MYWIMKGRISTIFRSLKNSKSCVKGIKCTSLWVQKNPTALQYHMLKTIIFWTHACARTLCEYASPCVHANMYRAWVSWIHLAEDSSTAICQHLFCTSANHSIRYAIGNQVALSSSSILIVSFTQVVSIDYFWENDWTWLLIKECNAFFSLR